jgi:hypothetical protein
MTSRLLLASAMLLPAIASAQPVPEPQDPNEPNQPADQTPPAPPPVSEPVVTDPPPTVIVNPAPRATVVTTEPAYELVEDDWNAPVFATGALVFAGSYAAAVIAAASQEDDERDRWAERLYVPVVGPWLALNDHGSCPIENPACDDETTTKVLLIADGVFQAGGVVTMVTGLLRPSYHRRVVRTASTDRVRVRPTVVGRGGSGLMVFGQW